MNFGDLIMYSHFRLKLFLVLSTFAIVVTSTITVFDYLRLKEEIKTETEIQLEQATEGAINALQTVDKAFNLLDPKISDAMEKNTAYLLNKYEANSDFTLWNFDRLAEKLNMDIYILDEKNVIRFSNVKAEIGLDFEDCCKRLNEILHERRSTGNLYIDEIDLSLQSKNPKKFSYKATEDQKYLIELGYDLSKEEIYREFDFLKTVNHIVEEFTFIKSINILNYGGIAYGTNEEGLIPSERLASFRQVRDSGEPLEINTVYKGNEAVIAYIPVQSLYDESSTQFKVIEIIYEDEGLNPYIATNYPEFIMQLTIIGIFTLIASSLIANWFSKPIYYAYHDSLTGLKNRTAFDEVLDTLFEENNNMYMLIMLDLDNFKLVNDRLGHSKGDSLLKDIGQTLAHTTNGHAFRLGGDEFAIVKEIDDNFVIDHKAQYILREVNKVINNNSTFNKLSVSVSIGIAYTSPECNTKDLLYKQADIALYIAKEKGKNRYEIYNTNRRDEAQTSS